MKTLEIIVEDKDVERVRSILDRLDYITVIKEPDKDREEWVSLVSEPSLSEDWESDEDSRYEKYFKQ